MTAAGYVVSGAVSLRGAAAEHEVDLTHRVFS